MVEPVRRDLRGGSNPSLSPKHVNKIVFGVWDCMGRSPALQAGSQMGSIPISSTGTCSIRFDCLV